MVHKRLVKRKCPHGTFSFEEDKGYVCDECGHIMTDREKDIRRLKWMMFIGRNPALE